MLEFHDMMALAASDPGEFGPRVGQDALPEQLRRRVARLDAHGLGALPGLGDDPSPALKRSARPPPGRTLGPAGPDP